MKIIKLIRKKSWIDFARNYKIYVDGQIVGDLKPNEEKTLELSENVRSLHLGLDWCTSNSVKLDQQEHEVAVAPNYSPLAKQILNISGYILVLDIILSVFFAYNKLVWLLLPALCIILFNITINRSNYIKLSTIG